MNGPWTKSSNIKSLWQKGSKNLPNTIKLVGVGPLMVDAVQAETQVGILRAAAGADRPQAKVAAGLRMVWAVGSAALKCRATD
jgi:hypothetical protein